MVNFSLIKEFILKFKLQIILVVIGIAILILGLVVLGSIFSQENKVEIIQPQQSAAIKQTTSEVIVEIAGSVEKPGVYKMGSDARIDDVLIKAGGLSVDANREYVEKNINRALKVSDGQKIYIPSENEQSSVLSASISNPTSVTEGGLININTASATDLDSLSGIGPTYAQKIVEQRPYSKIDELVSKKVIGQSLFDKIKDKITVF